MEIDNNLAAIRRRRGAAAADLARAAGISRQTIYAIEAGSYVPNTAVSLRLARALEVSVDDLFRLKEADAPPAARTSEVEMIGGDAGLRAGQPVELCRVGKRTVGVAGSPLSWRLPPADALVVRPAGRRRHLVQLIAGSEAAGRLLIAGCDPAASVLARHLGGAAVELVVASCNSSQSLQLLKRGLVHIAGSHLGDNLPAVGKLFPRRAAAIVSFARWEEGLVVAHGNPKGIRGVEDLARKDIRLINREPGAGSRLLLDRRLRRLGLPGAKVQGYGDVAYGHLPAAWQVKLGQADCCLATGAAARVLGLGFLPLTSERYDLVIRREHMKLQAIERLMETLAAGSFRRELQALAGYDASQAGKIIDNCEATLPAARQLHRRSP